MIDDRLEQRAEIIVELVGLCASSSRQGLRVQNWKVRLLVGSAQLDEQIQRLIHDPMRSRGGAIDLIHHQDRLEPTLQGVTQHKTRLRHRTLDGIHQQQHTIYHVQYPLDLAAKVGVPRCIHETDRLVLVVDGRILRRNRDAPLTLQIIGVENTIVHLLIGTEDIRLLQHAVEEGRLPVIDVGDDGNVAELGGAVGHAVLVPYER